MRLITGTVLTLLGCILAHGQPLIRSANTTLDFPQSLPSSGFKLEPAFPNLRTTLQPVAIVTPPTETNRLFVVERSGRIRVVPDLRRPQWETFLDIRRRTVSRSGEQGLLGLAFHPDYRRNLKFYVFYTATGAGEPNRLSQFQTSPDHPNRALPESEIVLFSQWDDAGNHNGGDLHFGPDGYLYVALGDEGNANDTLGNSQRIDRDFYAGILRLDVDKRPGNLEPNRHSAIELDSSGKAYYSVPADNPWVGTTSFNGQPIRTSRVRTEFWAVGLRNPWRMAFDPVSGELFAGDVGQGRREEINRIVRGGNYGWNYREGSITGPRPNDLSGNVEFEEPILEYSHGTGDNQGRSVTGGVFYRGDRWAQLYGAYLFADYVSGNLWMMRYDGNQTTGWNRLARKTGISAFGVDPRNGDILVADYQSHRLLRLIKDDAGAAEPFPETLSLTGAFEDLTNLSPNPGILPYSLNTPFWSDHAIKSRWFSVPEVSRRIGFSAEDNWSFPSGSVWIKHFELETKTGDPDSRRPLETRFIVHPDDSKPGEIYGLTYRWNEQRTEAFLVPEEGAEEIIPIEENGVMREQIWRYPSRSECLACHTQSSGGILGFNTAQLNRTETYGDTQINQLLALQQAGYFDEGPDATDELPRTYRFEDEEASLTQRVRSYLEANCSQCHRPDGVLGLWDARLQTPLEQTGLIDGPLVNPSIYPEHRIVVAGDPHASELLRRITSTGKDRMPPLASNRLDQNAIELISRWLHEELPRESLDSWALRYFGKPIDSELADADPDRDRLPNRLEYRLGTHPLDPHDAWGLRIRTENGTAILSFPLIPDPELRLELQRTTDLFPAQWSAVTLNEPSPFYGRPGTEGTIELSPGQATAAYYRVLFHD